MVMWTGSSFFLSIVLSRDSVGVVIFECTDADDGVVVPDHVVDVPMVISMSCLCTTGVTVWSLLTVSTEWTVRASASLGLGLGLGLGFNLGTAGFFGDFFLAFGGAKGSMF